jgi:hypothetical protein
MTIAGAPLASGPEQNSAYARNKEGRFGKPGRPSLFPLIRDRPFVIFCAPLVDPDITPE